MYDKALIETRRRYVNNPERQRISDPKVNVLDSWEGLEVKDSANVHTNGKKKRPSKSNGLNFGRPSRHNLEYDQGRVKKVRGDVNATKFGQKVNPFQAQQTKQNKAK